MDWTNEQRPPRPRSHWPLEQLIKNGGFGEKFFYDLEAGAGVKIQISHTAHSGLTWYRLLQGSRRWKNKNHLLFCDVC